MKNKELKEVVIFFLITILLSFFVFWGPIALFKVPAAGFGSGAVGPVWAIVLFIIGGFVPSLTGIFLTRAFEGKKQVKQLLKKAFQVKIRFKWFSAIILTSAYFAAAWIIINAVLGGNFDYGRFLTLLPSILPLLILGPLSEEFGWRGFALKRLLNIASPNAASLTVGFIWSLWHLPLFYMLGTSQYEQGIPFIPFMISVISSSFIYTYFYIKTNGNLFAAVLIHWSYTFFATVVQGGIKRTDLFSSLECLPALLVGIVFVFIMRNGQRTDRGTVFLS